ncbi:MAG TPA: response regulator [Chthoniobacteraceae bacterium]|nr:response regulator [Chthoniobacteraceae bacterium]
MNPRRILIVDDESGFTKVVKLTLEKSGNYLVQEENDAARAHSTARLFRPDLIFLDIVMPKIDGGDVAAQIRGDAALKHVPIIFLTAIVSNKEACANDMMGGFPFLAKPISLDRLVECIEKHAPVRG